MVFYRESPYNAAVGVRQRGRQAYLLYAGIFLTWAAKPSVRDPLNPA